MDVIGREERVIEVDTFTASDRIIVVVNSENSLVDSISVVSDAVSDDITVVVTLRSSLVDAISVVADGLSSEVLKRKEGVEITNEDKVSIAVKPSVSVNVGEGVGVAVNSVVSKDVVAEDKEEEVVEEIDDTNGVVVSLLNIT